VQDVGGPTNINILAPPGIEYWCEAAELPGRTLATLDRKTYGLTTKVPMQIQYSDITLTFICMANKVTGTRNAGSVTPETGLTVKRFFDIWMQSINSIPEGPSEQSGNYNFDFRNNYSVPITITHFDMFESPSNGRSMPTYIVKLEDAYPISVGALGMNWGDDGILRLPVTFAYTRWWNSDRTGYQSRNEVLSTQEAAAESEANRLAEGLRNI
jgi:hypothetical protein